jgi:CheY-like chemotaxis protein
LHATATQSRILLVEDDDVTARPLTKILNRLGYDVAQVTTLADALERLDDWAPRCVFLDLSLPDGDGIGVLRQIREFQQPISVAVTTGMVDEDLLADVNKLLPDALFTKPLRLPDLMDWLYAATRRG